MKVRANQSACRIAVRSLPELRPHARRTSHHWPGFFSPFGHRDLRVTANALSVLISPRKARSLFGVPKILVFDDDPPTLELHVEILGGAGHALLTATDGAEALVLMDQNPDLIVADVGTPRVDGYEFIRRVRRSATHSSVPIIVISGAEVSQRAIGVGADRFLQKPVSPTALRAAVDELLNTRGKGWY